MALLFVSLILRGSVTDDLGSTASGLLRHLSLLFVPAGVGVTTHLALLAEEAVPIAAALLISTLAAIAVGGLLMASVGPGSRPEEDQDEEGRR
jgi:holin-like protein